VARFLGFRNLIAGTVVSGSRFEPPLGTLPVVGIVEDQITLPGTIPTLLIRPEGARLAHCSTAANDDLQLTGTITDRQFQGSTYRLNLHVDKLSLSFDLPIDPPPPEIGQPIHLLLNPSALILLSS
jgi:ABC-type Fe3+/spermidine/putrescine transport system ATPase subunit